MKNNLLFLGFVGVTPASSLCEGEAAKPNSSAVDGTFAATADGGVESVVEAGFNGGGLWVEDVVVDGGT